MVLKRHNGCEGRVCWVEYRLWENLVCLLMNNVTSDDISLCIVLNNKRPDR